MRISTVALTMGVLTALSSMPALAGQPADPGAGGQATGDVNDFAKATDQTPGEVKQAITEDLGENFGQVKKDAIPDGRPTH